MARQPRQFMRQGVGDLLTREAVLAYLGVPGEPIFDRERLRIMDGQTPGGIGLATVIELAGKLGTIATIAALRSYSVLLLSAGSAISVTCHTAGGDGGGGVFRWDATATGADDGGTRIKPNGFADGTPGRWLRQFTGDVSLAMFGCGANPYDRTAYPPADHTAQINAAQAAAVARGVKCYAPPQNYGIAKFNQVFIGSCGLYSFGACYNQAPNYYNYTGAWFWLHDYGAQSSADFSTKSITSAGNNGSNKVRLYIGSHDYTTRTRVKVAGTSGYNGVWSVIGTGSNYIDINAGFTNSQTGTLKRWDAHRELGILTCKQDTVYGGEPRLAAMISGLGIHCRGAGNQSFPAGVDNIRYAGVLSTGVLSTKIKNNHIVDVTGAAVWIDLGTRPTASDWQIVGNLVSASGCLGRFASAVVSYASNGSGGTRIVTAKEHGFTSGDSVYVEHATAASLNGRFAATVINATTFDIPVAYTAATKGWVLLYEKWANYHDNYGLAGYGANDGEIGRNDISGFCIANAVLGLVIRHHNNVYWLNDIHHLMVNASGEGSSTVGAGNFYYDSYGPAALIDAAPAYTALIDCGDGQYYSAGLASVWWDNSMLVAIYARGANYNVKLAGATFGNLPLYGQITNYGFFAESPATVTFYDDDRGMDVGCTIGLTNVPYRRVSGGGNTIVGTVAVRGGDGHFADLFIPVGQLPERGLTSVAGTGGNLVLKLPTGNHSGYIMPNQMEISAGMVRVLVGVDAGGMTPGQSGYAVDDGTPAGVVLSRS